MTNVHRLARDQTRRVDKLEAPQDLADAFVEYATDPVGFVREVLGVEPEPYQIEILGACVGTPRIAWRAGHGVGKTALLSWALLWWLLTRKFSRVFILAPAMERQVGRYLLPEVRKWARNAPEQLPITVRAHSVEVNGYEKDWFALAVQATDPSKVEGGHAESLCILADEAKGLNADVIGALHGAMTDRGGDRLYFLASVPGGPSGPFYDTFRKGSGLWRLFHTKAADSALVSPTWEAERKEEWGEGSPIFQARVLGEFPEEAEGTLFKLTDLEAAVERELIQENPALTFGVDVARFGGDRSSIAMWHGKHLPEAPIVRRGLDTMATAAWVAAEINRQNPAKVSIDEIGVGGGVVDRLRQLGHKIDGVMVSRGAFRPELFLNLRAELFWLFREALEKGEASLPKDEGLLAELSSIRYHYAPHGAIQLEKKEETKKRVGHSPDLADAVVLGYPITHISGMAQLRKMDLGTAVRDLQKANQMTLNYGVRGSGWGV